MNDLLKVTANFGDRFCTSNLRQCLVFSTSLTEAILFKKKQKMEEGKVRLSDVIKECAKRVYDNLGFGYSESVYHRAMETEFRLRGISYESKVIHPIHYLGYHIGHCEADLVVFDEKEPQVIVELKAVTTDINKTHVAQLEMYLRERCDINSGMIVNFRQPCNSTRDDSSLTVEFLELLRNQEERTGTEVK